MKIIEKEAKSVRAVDWSKPLVLFDPWPFYAAGVPLAPTVFFLDVDGTWCDGSAEWTLEGGRDNILGTTTLGETFVTSLVALDKLS